MYGKLIDGKLVYAPKNYLTDDNRMIFNFNNNVELMKNNGFKEVEDIVPSYDATTHYVIKVGYNEGEDKIVVNYEVLEKELTYAEKLVSQQELAMSFLADNLTDEQAVQVPLIFEAWQVGVNYKVGKKLVYEEVLYKVLQDHTSQETWTPKDAPSLFARVLVDDGGAVLDWVQPESTNPYMKGDRVKFEGKIYESLIDNNVWSPTAYPAGWKEIS